MPARLNSRVLAKRLLTKHFRRRPSRTRLEVERLEERENPAPIPSVVGLPGNGITMPLLGETVTYTFNYSNTGDATGFAPSLELAVDSSGPDGAEQPGRRAGDSRRDGHGHVVRAGRRSRRWRRSELPDHHGCQRHLDCRQPSARQLLGRGEQPPRGPGSHVRSGWHRHGEHHAGEYDLGREPHRCGLRLLRHRQRRRPRLPRRERERTLRCG